DPVTAADRDMLSLEFNEADYRKEFQVGALAKDAEYGALERNWLRPVLEVNGLKSGYGGAGMKTIIPSEALAKLSFRLVPGQDPEEVGQQASEFLRKLFPSGMEVDIKIYPGAPAFRVKSSAPILGIMRQVLKEMMGKECKIELCGASIPIVPAIQKASSAEALIVGFALPTDDIHAPNEHFSLQSLQNGFLMEVCLFAYLEK